MSTKPKKKKATLINGIDFDEWVDKTDEIALEPESSTLSYEKKLVAFLDLLGITNEIRDKINGAESEIISKLSKIKDIVSIEVNAASIETKIDMLYLSDSFIFVCDPDALAPFLQVLSNIQMRILVECKTMLRGALEYGDVKVHDGGRQIIGPAYIDAYLRQEKHAIFPRIIIGNSALAIIEDGQHKYDEVIISQDREVSLDYIDVYMVLEKKSTKEIATLLVREGVLKYLHNGYKKHHTKNDSSVRSKYAWTINYLKEKGVWSNAKQYNCW